MTVLFADLVGFTTLSEARDPEQVKNLVERCFERLAADVTAYGGRVDKVLGDAMVALFGAPVAHEDDAERAVRAALQMQRSLEAFAADLDGSVRMRVGVNTGEVLVGAIRAGDDYTAMGDVVNVASRLQSTAEPGQVVVGPATRQATSRVVDYRMLGPIEVRGRDEPVDAWVALETLTPPGHRPRRLRTPLVGRDAEMGMLRNALTAAARHRRPHLVLLSGEAGIGKSRLGEELAAVARSEHDAAIYVGRCVPYGEANPWWPVSEILRQAFGIDLADPHETSREKIGRGVELATRSEGERARRVVDGILYLTGLGDPLVDVDPARALDEVITAITELVVGLASHRLVLLFLADLHWADQVVLDLVDRLVERLHNLPVVVVGSARPELEERWSPRPGRHNVLRLHLDPLDEDAIGQLLDAMLGDDAPAGLRGELMERSGGNPFFVEELAALLAESGMLGGDAPAGEPTAPGLRDLPSSLRGLIAARLDAVGARERATIEAAAVVGRIGPLAALVAMGEGRSDGDVGATVDELAARGLLVVDGEQFEFKSELVREVAYETLTKSSRARRHAEVGTWLSARAAETGREDELIEQIAHHHAEAAVLSGEIGGSQGVPPDVRERALEWLERAAVRARDRDATLVAEQLFDEALGLLSADETAARRRLLLGRAAARAGLHDLAGARRDVTEVLGDADAGTASSDDAARRVEALTVLGEVQQKEGDVVSALSTFEAAMALADEIGDRHARAEALRRWGMARLFGGELEHAESAIAEAWEAFRALGERRSEAWALQNLAWIAFERGDAEAADRRLSEAAALFEDLSDWGGRGWALGLLGFVRLTQGRLDEAGELADEVIEEARKAGDRWGLGMTLVLRSSVDLWLGRAVASAESAREARRVFEGIDDTYGRSLAVANLARASTNLGRLADARAFLEESVELFERQSVAMQLMGRTLRTNVLAQLGDARAALAAADGARGPADETGRDTRGDAGSDAAGVPTELLAAKALALLQSERIGEALSCLERVLDPAHVSTGPGDEGARTYALAVAALAHAAAGDPDASIAAGREVPLRERGTYLDETYADVGTALAHARGGDAPVAGEILERAVRRVDATEDRLSQAVVRLARARALETLGDDDAGAALGEARERFAALGIDPYGWEAAFAAAGAGARSAGGDE